MTFRRRKREAKIVGTTRIWLNGQTNETGKTLIKLEKERQIWPDLILREAIESIDQKLKHSQWERRLLITA